MYVELSINIFIEIKKGRQEQAIGEIKLEVNSAILTCRLK